MGEQGTSRRALGAAAVAAIAVGPVLALIAAAPASAAPITVSTWLELQTVSRTSLLDPVVLGADITAGPADGLYVPSGFRLEIDLNGHTLNITNPLDGLPAMWVAAGGSLTIDGAAGGTLNVRGGSGYNDPDLSQTAPAPAIGGYGAFYGDPSYNSAGGDCGSLTIHGGTINATGGSYQGANGDIASAPGIGGGPGVATSTAAVDAYPDIANSGDGCDITITGGTVTATSGLNRAPGIGSGSATLTRATATVGAAGTLTLPGIGTVTTPPAPADAKAGQASTATTTAGLGPDVSFATTSLAAASNTYGIRIGTVVTYDEGNGTVRAEPAAYDTPLTEPADPIRSGFLFTGWRTASPTGPAYNFTAAVDRPITLYASYTPIAAVASASATPQTTAAASSATPVLAATGIDLQAEVALLVTLLTSGIAALAIRRRRGRA